MTKRNRDDFSSQVKRTLEQRVSSRCSNPNCRVPTSGPTTQHDKVSNIGKAAHITAAARGGPRFDSSMMPSQRRSISNGIWLCANCADVIDRDPKRYSVADIHNWKRHAEETAQREQGTRPPSERELAVFKAKALGEHVGMGSVGELVSEVKRIGEQEISKIDPRFSATISLHHDRTEVVLMPREPVSCMLRIPCEVAAEFQQKFDALAKHGYPLEIQAAGLQIQGSPIFAELAGQPKRLVLETLTRRKAIQRVTWTDVETSKLMAAEFVGELCGGTESVTFTGSLFDGLYRASYQLPLSAIGTVATINSTGNMTFAPWEGKSLRCLPYLEKYRSLCKAISAGAALASSIECDGQELSSIGSLSIMSPTYAMEMADVLGYLIRVRDVLTFFQQDIAYRMVAIPAEEVTELNELWFWLCHYKSLRGSEIGTANFTFRPQDENQASHIRELVRKGEPATIRMEQQQASSLTLLGQTIEVGPVTFEFNQVIPEIKGKPSTIRVGQSIQVFLVPTGQSCVVPFVKHKEHSVGLPLQPLT